MTVHMIGNDTRNEKTINDIDYLYYIYGDYGGKRITKYCGRNGTAQAKIIALKTEIENLKVIRDSPNVTIK